MSCCDYVVATADIRIALSEGKLGILYPPSLAPMSTDDWALPPSADWPCKPVEFNSEEALRIGFIEAVGRTQKTTSNAT